MAMVENTVSVRFTRDEVDEVIRQAALAKLAERFPNVRRENVSVMIYARVIDEMPYFATAAAALFVEGGEP